MLSYILNFAAFFVLAAVLISTFHFLPKKNFGHHSIKFASRYTEVLRTGKPLGKVFFWAAPIVIFLFANALAGVVILIANGFATMFSKRYAAAMVKPDTPVETGEPVATAAQ
jgi:hypothetical protein